MQVCLSFTKDTKNWSGISGPSHYNLELFVERCILALKEFCRYEKL